MTKVARLTAAVFAAAATAAAQTPAAPEFIVNSYTTNAQARPSLSMDGRGNFVIAWNSFGQDGNGDGVVGQRFDAAGARMGAEFLVNTVTLATQFDPDVAVDRNGDFVVVWTEVAGSAEIKARRFSRSGAPRGVEFRVNSYTTGAQDMPAVASDAVGNFVVVWQSPGQDGNGYGVFGHRFDAGGTSIGSDFQVNTYTTGNQRRPDVAPTIDGGFVVVFDGPDTFAQGIHARLYSPSGNPIGGDTPISTALASQSVASVAARAPEGFVVAWTSYSQDGSHNGVFARFFDAAGSPLIPELPVNTFTTNAQSFPVVASDGAGAFVVTWESFLQDGSDAGVFGQRFTEAGQRRGTEFAVNTYTSGAQVGLAVVSDVAGNFTVAWGSGQDGSGTGVIARRFQGIVPVALAVDTQGNGVLEVAEVVALVPSWRNTTAAAQSFLGGMLMFTGPLPATYFAPDMNAAYGPVPAGAVASCSVTADCYAVSVNASTRPAAHWDASFHEAIGQTPAAEGLRKQWALHVGDSFTDVARTSPFYRFVETLLHHGVTGGCGPGVYCPSALATREEMAVFVLVAIEGAGYAPPACTTPVFGDVPAANPFCRWIEELARRGVVSGCGSGNYCPSAPVTREQMAVFVLRALDATLNPPACVPPNLYFDVPESNPFCRWIEELTRRGIVSGCGGGNYCPTAVVTREQMGVFISVTFGLTLYGP